MLVISEPEEILTGAAIAVDLIHTAETKAIDYLHGWRSAIPIYEIVFVFKIADPAIFPVQPSEDGQFPGGVMRRLALTFRVLFGPA